MVGHLIRPSPQNMGTHTHTHAYARKHMHTIHTHTHSHTHTHTQYAHTTHTCTHCAHTHTHTHACAHAHTQKYHTSTKDSHIPVWSAVPHRVCTEWRTFWPGWCCQWNPLQPASHGWWSVGLAPSWPQYGSWSWGFQAAPDDQRSQDSVEDKSNYDKLRQPPSNLIYPTLTENLNHRCGWMGEWMGTDGWMDRWSKGMTV